MEPSLNCKNAHINMFVSTKLKKGFCEAKSLVYCMSDFLMCLKSFQRPGHCTVVIIIHVLYANFLFDNVLNDLNK